MSIETDTGLGSHLVRLARENAELRARLQSLVDAVTYPYSDEPECNVTFHRNLDNAIEASQVLLESIQLASN